VYPIKFDKKKYYVVIGEEEREVFPIGDFSFIWDLQDSNIYRLNFDGEIIFKNYFSKDKEWINDYTYLDSLKTSRYVEFRAKRYCSGSYTTFYNGYINLLGKWNIDNQILSTDIQPNDGYDLLARDIDKKFNLPTIGAGQLTSIIAGTETYNYTFRFYETVYNLVRNILPEYTFVSSFISATLNPITGLANEFNHSTIASITDISTVTTSPTDEYFCLQDVLNFAENRFNCYAYVDYENKKFYIEHKKFFENNLSYTVAKVVDIDLTTLKDGRFILNSNNYNYDEGLIFKKETFKYSEFGRESFSDSEITYDCLQNNDKEYSEDIFLVDVSYIQNYPDKAPETGIVFFCNDNLSNTYSEDLVENRVNNTLVSEIDSGGTFTYISPSEFDLNNTDNLFLSLNNLINSDINIGDSFRIEFDLIDSDIYISVLCAIIDDISDFSGSEISNDFRFTNVHTTHITTILTINTLPTSGNVFLGFTNLNDMAYSFRNFKLTKILSKNVLNYPMSFQSLLPNYWKHGRCFLNGEINGVETDFISKQYLKVGSEIKNVPICCDIFDPYELVKTDIGNGRIKKATENKDGTYNLEIIYK